MKKDVQLVSRMLIQEYGKYYNKSKDLFESKKFNEAINEAKKGLVFGENNNLTLHESKLRKIIGDSYAILGYYEECIKWWMPACSEYFLLDDTIGYNFFKLKIYDKAEEYYRKCIQENLKNASIDLVSHACSKIGEIYLFKNEPNIAFSFLNTAKSIGTYSKRSYDKALQLSKGMGEKDELIDLIINSKLIIQEKRVEQKHVSHSDEVLRIISKSTSEARSSYRELDDYTKDSRYLWCFSEIEYSDLWGIEIQIVDKYWRNEHISKLKNLIEKYRWETWKHLDSESVFDDALFFQIKQDLKNKGLRDYVSANYYKYKMKQYSIQVPTPKQVKCKLCGTIFLEINSIGEYDWKYCYKCTLSAYRGAFKNYKSKKEMILDLQRLVDKLGYIPPKTFMNIGYPGRDFWRNIPKEKIHEIMPIMVEILPAKAYDIAFGSWFEALIESGVIQGAQKGIYGHKCLATDGHECLSIAEKIIDDWLFENKIPHMIEPYYPFDDELNPNGGLRADWKVNETLIEFFGLTGNKDYDMKTKIKQDLAQKNHLELISIFPDDLYDLNIKLKNVRCKYCERSLL